MQQLSLGRDGSTVVIVGDDLTARVIDLDRRAQVGVYGPEGTVVLDALAAADGRIAVNMLELLADADGLVRQPAHPGRRLQVNVSFARIGDGAEPAGQYAHPARREVGDDRCSESDQREFT